MIESKPINESRLGWIAPAVVVVLFAQIVGFEHLNWVDPLTIFQNPFLRPVSIHSFIEAWTSPHLNLWIPLTHSLWAILAWIGRDGTEISPLAFRVTSLALHMASAWIVFDLLFKLTRSDHAALCGALLFAVHPIQVESVAWISGQKDLLAGFFMLASTRAFVNWRENPSPGRFIITLSLFLFSMLSQPVAVTTPLIWFAIALTDRIDWRTLLIVSAGLFMALPFVVIACIAQPASLIQDVSPIDRLVVAGDALAFDFRHLVAPWPLVIDYARTPQVVLSSSKSAIWWVVPAALICLGFLLKKSLPQLLAGVLVVIACVLPVLGFLPFEFQMYSTVCDHYLYVALLGPALIISAIVAKHRATFGMFIALWMIAMVVSVRQVEVWRDDQKLFKHNLNHYKQSLAANRTLAYLAAEQGNVAWAERYFHDTFKTRPDDDLSAYNFANFLARQMRREEALEQYNRAIQVRSDHPAYRYNRALLLMQLNRPHEAMIDVQRVLAIDPNYPDAVRLRDLLEVMIDPTDPLDPTKYLP